MTSHPRPVFLNSNLPMQWRPIGQGVTNELQLRKEAEAFAYNNALNDEISRAFANAQQNFTQPLIEQPITQAISRQNIQNGASVEMGPPGLRLGGKGIQKVARLTSQLASQPIARQQNSQSGAPNTLRISHVNTEISTQPPSNQQIQNSQQVASKNSRKRSLGETSEGTVQSQDTQPRKSRSPPSLSSPFPALPVAEQDELNSLMHAFKVAAQFCWKALNEAEDSERREIMEAWTILEQHFQGYESYIREKADRDRRRVGMANLVTSTQAQLDNIKVLMALW